MRHTGVRSVAFAAAGLAWLVSLCALSGWGEAQGRPSAIRTSSKTVNGSKPPPLVNADDELASFLAQAEELAEKKAWNRAIDIIQALIERPDSGFVPAPDGRQYISLWHRANELIGRMGPEGLKLYRRRFNPPAQQMYEKAMASGDEKLLRRVVQRYLWSDPGILSLEALGALSFDEGRFHQAARFWRRALSMRRGSDAEPLLLAKIAAAYHLVGKDAQARALAEELKKAHPRAEATLAGRPENLADFVSRVMKLDCSVPGWRRREFAGWPGMGGIPDGLGVMADSEVVLAPRWRQPEPDKKAPTALSSADLIAGKSALQAYRPRFRMTLQMQKGHVHLSAHRSGSSSASSRNQGRFLLPPLLHPVVVGDTVIWRQDDDVCAHDVFTGEFKWRSRNLPFEAPSGSSVPSSSTYYPYVKMGECGHYTLTVGGGKVFTLYHYSMPKRYRPSGWVNPNMGGPKAADRSAIAALLIKAEGKLAWKTGNGKGDHEVVRNGKFLTAPTYHDGRLYVTAVYLQGYYLLCLDADTGSHIWSAMIAQTPAITNRHHYPMGYVFYRGSPPAVAGGAVFALTNSGALAAFEAETGRALWAYQYDSKVNSPSGLRYGTSGGPGVYNPPNPLIVARGRVICMPADSSSVLALAVEDGRLLWSAERDQQDLSAIDADRILLSGPGLIVLSAEDGQELFRADDKGINGRPAVTEKAVLASGPDAILRLDLSDYSRLTRLGLSGASGLLGSLVSMKGKLIAANAAGVCAYFDYEHARSALAQRIEKASAEDEWRLRFQQAQLAFNAKYFDDALEGLQTCAAGASADRLKRLKLAPWFYRTYVALGNRAADEPEKMLALFTKAEPYASTDRAKAHLRIRMAKYHEAAGDHSRAVAAAHAVGRDYPQLKVADVVIGHKADDTMRFGPESEKLTGKRWSRQYVAGLIRGHGRAVYAELDAEASQAFKRAKMRRDPDDLVAVARRWPNSKFADRALFAAAELCYLSAIDKKTLKMEAEKLLHRAIGYLTVVGNDETSPMRVSANVALAIIFVGGEKTATAMQSLNQVRDEPKDTPVAFAHIEGTLGELVRDISGGNLPTFQARVSLASVIQPPLEKVFSLTDQEVYVLRDQEYRPIRLGQRILVLKRDPLKGNRAVFLDTSAGKGTGEGQWTGLAPDDPSMSRYLYAPGYGLVSGFSRDNKVLCIASRSRLRGLHTQTAKVVWDKSMADIGIGSFACMGAGCGVLVAADSRGQLSCVDIATGAERWRAKLVGSGPRPSGPPRIAAGCVFVRHNSFRTLVCLNVENGKVIGKWDAKQYLSVYPTEVGLVAMMIDDELTVRDVGKLGEASWFHRYGPSSGASILAVSPNRVVVSPNQGTGEVKVLSLIGKQTVGQFQAGKTGGASAVPIDARLSGDRLYVVCSTTTSGRRKTMYGRLSRTRGLCVQMFDLADKKPGPVWNSQLLTPQRSDGYLMPLVVGEKHVVACVKHYSSGMPSAAFVLDGRTGRVRHRYELIEHGAAGAAAQYRRLRAVGPPVMTNGRLCVEDAKGLTVYGGQ